MISCAAGGASPPRWALTGGVAMSRSDGSDSCAALFDALAQGNAAEVARLLAEQEVTLIETPSDAAGAKGAFIAEFNDYPVLVAFTSTDHAATFAAANPDLLGEDGGLPAFVVSGSVLLRYLPEGIGVVLNPQTNA